MLKRVPLFAVVMAVLVCGAANAGGMWARGSIHDHTNNSDGNVPTQAVVDWYKGHGYQFLVITDHNKLIMPPASDGKFLMIPGEEVTSSFDKSPIHVNAIGTKSQISPVTGKDKTDTLQKNVDLIVNDGGIAQINHPNWYYALTAADMKPVKNCCLFEICNAGSSCNNEGDSTHASLDQAWDEMLSTGMDIYGTATDDAHNYIDIEGKMDVPGKGWIMVRVNKLTRAEVMDNLKKGNFYATTGVELTDTGFRRGALNIAVKPAEGKTYRISFIGFNGKLLQEVSGTRASYKITGKPEEAYVRAKITASDGAIAWTQPVRAKR